jgi:hypothetical protein
MYIANILPFVREFNETVLEKLNDTATNYTLPIFSNCLDSTVLQQEVLDWQYYFVILFLLFIVCFVMICMTILIIE